MKTSLKIFAVIGLLAPILALGQPTAPTAHITSYQGVINLLGVIINWLFAILITLAVIFIIIAAFKYLTASGDPEKVKGANHSLIYAVVAIAVAIVAKAIPWLVASIIGVQMHP